MWSLRRRWTMWSQNDQRRQCKVVVITITVAVAIVLTSSCAAAQQPQVVGGALEPDVHVVPNTEMALRSSATDLSSCVLVSCVLPRRRC